MTIHIKMANMNSKWEIFKLNDLEKFNYTSVRGLHSNWQAGASLYQSNQSLQLKDQGIWPLTPPSLGPSKFSLRYLIDINQWRHNSSVDGPSMRFEFISPVGKFRELGKFCVMYKLFMNIKIASSFYAMSLIRVIYRSINICCKLMGRRCVACGSPIWLRSATYSYE